MGRVFSDVALSFLYLHEANEAKAQLECLFGMEIIGTELLIGNDAKHPALNNRVSACDYRMRRALAGWASPAPFLLSLPPLPPQGKSIMFDDDFHIRPERVDERLTKYVFCISALLIGTARGAAKLSLQLVKLIVLLGRTSMDLIHRHAK